MGNGIAIAGTTVVDHNNIITDYPDKGMLTNISSMYKHVGGCMPNTSLSLRKISLDIPIQVIATIGDDEDGIFLRRQLKKMNINIKNISVSNKEQTGFTNVMTVENTGERTFFFHEGANKAFSPNNIPIENLNVKIFHIGYIFLLKQFDKKNSKYGTNLAEVLFEIQEKNIKTSIDLASVNRDDYKEHVLPALRYTNYFIANEVEGGMITKINPYHSNGKINESNIKKILDELLTLGINDLAVIHSPEGGWAMDRNGKYYFSKSLELPNNYIKSTVGAGDAFCAGMLYSIYYNLGIKESLEIANAVAAMSLGGIDSYSNIKSIEKMKEFIKKYQRKEV